jgi:ATP-dependent DNA helicase RecG
MSRQEDLEQLIALGEGYTLEFKRSGTSHLGRELCAFANIEVCIFHDRVEIVNPGGLRAGMNPQDLGIKSIPRNPLLFGMLHRMEVVEHIGSGIRRMRRICQDYGVEEPRFEIDENWFTITFPRPVEARVGVESKISQTRVQGAESPILQIAGVESGVESAMAARILRFLEKTPRGKREIALNLGKERPSRYLNDLVKRLLEHGWLEYTIPDKPTSRLQKYRLTDKGRTWLGAQGQLDK